MIVILGYALFYNVITKWKLLKETVSMIRSVRMS
jgi:hypothetical protein